jgi:hypothetical protein
MAVSQALGAYIVPLLDLQVDSSAGTITSCEMVEGMSTAERFKGLRAGAKPQLLQELNRMMCQLTGGVMVARDKVSQPSST